MTKTNDKEVDLESVLDREVNHELLYDWSFFGEIKKRWPQAYFEDASDFLHEKRIALFIPGVVFRDLYLHALDYNYAGCLFTFQLSILSKQDKKFQLFLKEFLEDRKKENEA